MAAIQTVGPFQGVYNPDYALSFYRDGDPRRRINDVNLRSVTSIQAQKQLGDTAGTFSISLKDRAARLRISEMDAGVIKLKGHSDPFTTVLKCVVDEVRTAGSADVYAATEDTVISGRCTAKYLQITSLFLPVWDPSSILPTALIFGLGDVTKKGADSTGRMTPRSIFRYLVKQFVYGQRGIAGTSGVPNARFWLDHLSRFEDTGYEVPFVQFDEDAMATALKRFEILGFTETWVDELGRIVYRQPQWDAPAAYSIDTAAVKTYSFARSDVDVATYLEVIPAGDPGIDGATAQALRAGRAPVPSAYVNAAGQDSRLSTVSPEFIIETDARGKVTAKGARNPWYRKQRRLGLRPQQITSPLLFDQAQAQAQAEGLLEFFGRYTKTGSITIPLTPSIRLGKNVRVHGLVDGIEILRTYYVEGWAHEYVEGSHADTTLTLTHGRDPWDPKWGRIALPKFDPSTLSTTGGVLAPPDTSGIPQGAGAVGGAFNGKKGSVILVPGADRAGVATKQIVFDFLGQVAGLIGKTIYITTGSNHSQYTNSGNVSDHWIGMAADLGSVRNGFKNPDGAGGTTIAGGCHAIARGISLDAGRKIALANAGSVLGPPGANVTWNGYRVQILWMMPDHHDHVHTGFRKL